MTVDIGALKAIKRLGQDMRIARLKRRYTQADMSKKMGVSIGTVKRLESGDPGVSIGSLVMAFEVFGCMDNIESMLAEHNDPIGMMMTRKELPKRIRKRKLEKRSGAAPGGPGELTFSETGLPTF